jgi:hypothetical protein
MLFEFKNKSERLSDEKPLITQDTQNGYGPQVINIRLARKLLPSNLFPSLNQAVANYTIKAIISKLEEVAPWGRFRKSKGLNGGPLFHVKHQAGLPF